MPFYVIWQYIQNHLIYANVFSQIIPAKICVALLRHIRRAASAYHQTRPGLNCLWAIRFRFIAFHWFLMNCHQVNRQSLETHLIFHVCQSLVIRTRRLNHICARTHTHTHTHTHSHIYIYIYVVIICERICMYEMCTCIM